MKILRIIGIIAAILAVAATSAVGAIVYVKKTTPVENAEIADEDPAESKNDSSKKPEKRRNAQAEKPEKAKSFIAPLDVVLTNIKPRNGLETSAFIQLRISAEVSSEAATKVILDNRHRATNALLLATSETTKDDWIGTQIPATLKKLSGALNEAIGDKLSKDDFIYSVIVQDFAVDTEKFFIGEDFRNGYKN